MVDPRQRGVERVLNSSKELDDATRGFNGRDEPRVARRWRR
jgi:hypothetical protein